MEKRSVELKRELEKARLEEFKIMWKHANWGWRVIIITGILVWIVILWTIGSYIGRLIG